MRLLNLLSVIAMHAVFAIAGPAVLMWLWPGAVFRGPVLLPAGALVMLTGLFLYVRSHTDLTPSGSGSPAIWDPPAILRCEGIYRQVRNPMYLAVICFTAGFALTGGHWVALAYAFGLFVGFHLFVTRYEEPDIRARFGSSYAAYQTSVPRWLPRASRSTDNVKGGG